MKAYVAKAKACKKCSALEKRNKELEGALRGLFDIIDDSTGVSGYHINGNIADWDEFSEVQEAYDVLPAQEAKDDWNMPLSYRQQSHTKC